MRTQVYLHIYGQSNHDGYTIAVKIVIENNVYLWRFITKHEDNIR